MLILKQKVCQNVKLSHFKSPINAILSKFSCSHEKKTLTLHTNNKKQRWRQHHLTCDAYVTAIHSREFPLFQRQSSF